MATYIIEHLRHVRTVGEGAIASPNFQAWVRVSEREAEYEGEALRDYLEAQDGRDGRYRVLRENVGGFFGDEYTVARRNEFDVKRVERKAEPPVVGLAEAA